MPKRGLEQMYVLPIRYKAESPASASRPTTYIGSKDGKSAQVDLAEFSNGFADYVGFLGSGMTHFEIVHEGKLIGTFCQVADGLSYDRVCSLGWAKKGNLGKVFLAMSDDRKVVFFVDKGLGLGVFTPAIG